MKYKSMVTELSIYPETDNPIFGEGITKISLDDEGGGIFINISQPANTTQGILSFNIDEIDIIFESIKVLIEQEGVA